MQGSSQASVTEGSHNRSRPTIGPQGMGVRKSGIKPFIANAEACIKSHPYPLHVSYSTYFSLCK